MAKGNSFKKTNYSSPPLPESLVFGKPTLLLESIRNKIEAPLFARKASVRMNGTPKFQIN